MKYIMMESVNGGKFPFLFPDNISHAKAVKAAIHLLRAENISVQPVNAGFYDPISGKVSGNSESTGLTTNSLDAYRIKIGWSITYVPDETLRLSRGLK